MNVMPEPDAQKKEIVETQEAAEPETAAQEKASNEPEPDAQKKEIEQ